MRARWQTRAGTLDARSHGRRSRAFGLELEASFEVPGLSVLSDGAGTEATQLELVSPDAIDSVWPVGDATRLLEERLGTGSVQRTIDQHPSAGYRLYASGFGLAQIDADGRYIRCAPAGIPRWRWQRFLVGRVLPWAAMLTGLELFHASAVRVEGQAVALMGPTGAGKTSLAAHLVLNGAGFLTDDVLALDRDRTSSLIAHPGASLFALRAPEWEALSPSERCRLGTLLGRDDKAYVEVAAGEAAPLGAVYLLARDGPGERNGAGEGAAAETAPDERGAGEHRLVKLIERLEIPDPRVLLASTFVVSVNTPERLLNLLDVSAQLARSVPIFRVRVQSGVDAAYLAHGIADHAHELLGPTSL